MLPPGRDGARRGLGRATDNQVVNRPHGFAFMTVLPAGDGDVVTTTARSSTTAQDPTPFKCPAVREPRGTTNFFNREWLEDDHHGRP